MYGDRSFSCRRLEQVGGCLILRRLLLDSHLIDKYTKTINEGHMNVVVLLDLRKAFDLIDHSILQKKLRMYKCSTNSLDWFSSYVL